MSEPRHFLDLSALDGATLRHILDRAEARKAARPREGKATPDLDRPLAGKVLALLFEKPSTRTRISFDVGMRQLGGETLLLNAGETEIGRGESIADTARVMSRYVDGIMLRSRSHESLLELAASATVPVINGLTNRTHPCQLMADVLTFEEHRGPIAGRVVAWIGDGNNVAASWIEAAVRFAFELRLCCPPTLRPAADLLAWAGREGGRVSVVEEVASAAEGADCVVTDTWVSMNDADAERRRAALAPYRVDEEVMALAGGDAIFMHCLPAYRGEEVTAQVIDGPRSVVWDEAENRLHAQKGILEWCLA